MSIPQFKTIFKLFLLCTLIPLIQSQCTSNQGVSNTDLTGCTCCYSGYSGSTCSQTVGSTCFTNAPVPTPFSTASSPSLNSVNYNLDQLQLSVSSPVVRGRECGTNGTTLNLGLTNTDPACSAFVKSINATGCTDIWTTDVNWSDCLSKCEFTQFSQDSSFVTYLGYLLVSNIDTIDANGNVRTQSSTFPITVQFPVSLSASIEDIEVVAEFSLSALLSSQSYDPVTNLATLSFQTNAPWPYIFSTSTIDLPSTFTLETYAQDSNGESCDANSGPCIQYWSLVEQPTTGVCTLAGNYTISLTPTCRSGAGADCPYVTGDTILPAYVYAMIQSASFCPSLQADILVTPALTAVSAAGGSTVKNTFMQDNLAYFLFEATSTQAQISTLVLTSVSVSNIVDPIYSSGVTALGTSLLFLKNNADTAANQLPFQFNLNSTLFPSEVSFTVSATVDIYFTANAKRSVTFQRTVGQTSQNQTVTITTVKNTDNSSTDKVTSSAESSKLISMTLFGVLLLSLLSFA